MSKDQLHQRLLAVFASELSEHRQTLEQELLQLEQAQTAERRAELLESLFRAAHSLKGAARSVRMSGIERHCHRLEQHFHDLRNRTRVLDKALLSQLFTELDALSKEAEPLLMQKPRDETPKPEEPRNAEEPASPAAHEVQVADKFVRVAADKADALVTRTAELSALTSMLTENLTSLTDCREVLDEIEKASAQGSDVTPKVKQLGKALLLAEEALRRQTALLMRGTERTEEEAQRLLLMPIREATLGLERAVRDLSQTLDRPVELIIEDNDVEIDRAIAQRLRDPLLHLVRNAVGHGIEPREVRVRRKKPPLAKIVVRAVLIGRQVEVTVRDDGGGFDLEKLQKRAKAMQLPLDLSEQELLHYAFLPGFSTVDSVTELSGRGVGLDVVKRSIEAMHGTVELSSPAGQGSQFLLRLPLTLSKLRCIFVEAGGRPYAIPASHVVRIVRFSSEQQISVEGREMLRVSGAVIPLSSLSELLQLSVAKRPHQQTETALVLESAGRQVALLVEKLGVEREITARALPSRVGDVRQVSSATFLSLGRIALVLHPQDLCRRALMKPLESSKVRDLPAAPRLRVLVADDSPTTRAVLKNVLEQAQYDVTTASDGEQAFQLLQTGHYDALVSDVQMPRLDGFALAQSVRGHPTLKRLPVILVTSLENEADRLRGLSQGASAYLTKGAFDHRTLLEALSALL